MVMMMMMMTMLPRWEHFWTDHIVLPLINQPSHFHHQVIKVMFLEVKAFSSSSVHWSYPILITLAMLVVLINDHPGPSIKGPDIPSVLSPPDNLPF